MKSRACGLFIILTLFLSFNSYSQVSESKIKPANPKASPEARELLQLIYNISGKYILTGQHNYPNTKDKNSQFAASYLGWTPVIFSTDMGFAEDRDKDSYLARPSIIEEIKKQHKNGSIITICWHAVPPTADEPVSFSPKNGQTSQDTLKSVQGRLLDRQFKDILTPGTELYKRWCSQVDTIAEYLKQLRDANIPVLWRPYHEMNGGWFWWGGRTGNYGTATLYRQMFHRFTRHHKLNNLIWVWSVDRPAKPGMQFRDYYPGKKFLDIVSLDVYGNDFKQSYYDSLISISNGKPLVLGEVGNPPSVEIFKSQPKWTFYVIWAGMVRNTLKKQYRELLDYPRILFHEDQAYRNNAATYFSICGLPDLTKPAANKTDFSGEWIFNEEDSKLDGMGIYSIPAKMSITQMGDSLIIRKTMILEYADDIVTDEYVLLDGRESISELWNLPKITKAGWSVYSDTLYLRSRIDFKREDKNLEMKIDEFWTLHERGKVLLIDQYSDSMWGERKIKKVFNRN